jgi:hypothetical protein
LNKELLNENEENDISHRFLDRKKRDTKGKDDKKHEKKQKKSSKEVLTTLKPDHSLQNPPTKHIRTLKLKQHILLIVMFIQRHIR